MTTKKTTLLILAAALLIAIAAGCSPAQKPENTTPQQQGTTPAQQPGNTTAQQPENNSESYVFTDSAGRDVTLPRNIESVAPTGPLSQIVLFALCPDKLAGLASWFGDDQSEYLDGKYLSLPVFGNFYSDTLNLESVLLAAPQVIIDIGEVKPNNNDDLDGISDRTGIPTIFIQMDLGSILTAFETLGMITGETEQAERLIGYISKTLSETEQKLSTIPESSRFSIYYGQDDGLTAVVSGSIHADVVDLAGGVNVAAVEATGRSGTAMISPEQLILWDPDVILFAPGSVYGEAASLPEWSGLRAIKEGMFYEIPNGPYNWMGRPPSVNRILGIKWLSNLLYPDVFGYDMAAEAREFYRLFYHCELTDAQIGALLRNSG